MSMDGIFFMLQVHLVHYSAGYATLAEAVDKPEGLAVLGFLFEVDIW